jgi:hypothetical protein
MREAALVPCAAPSWPAVRMVAAWREPLAGRRERSSTSTRAAAAAADASRIQPRWNSASDCGCGLASSATSRATRGRRRRRCRAAGTRSEPRCRWSHGRPAGCSPPRTAAPAPARPLPCRGSGRAGTPRRRTAGPAPRPASRRPTRPPVPRPPRRAASTSGRLNSSRSSGGLPGFARSPCSACPTASGGSPLAVVVVHQGAQLGQATVIDACRASLGWYKKPSAVVSEPGSLARGPVGKVQRKVLHES